MRYFTDNPLERMMQTPAPQGASLPWLQTLRRGLRPALLPGRAETGGEGAARSVIF